MQSVLAYVRSLLGWCEEGPEIQRSFKRDRNDDDYSTDDDIPSVKRQRQSSFSQVMELKEKYEDDRRKRISRYQSVLNDDDRRDIHPSTSTPNVSTEKLGSRVRNIPIQLVEASNNGPSSSPRRYVTKSHSPARPVLRAVVLDTDEEDPEITWIKTKPEKKKQQKVIMVNLVDDDDNDDEENDNDKEEDDVIFVKKVLSPVPDKPYKYFVNKSELPDSRDEYIKCYKVCQKQNDRNLNNSPKPYPKFKAPPGITKIYKKSPTPIPRWMQTPRENLSQLKNKFSNLNGSRKSMLSDVFNLDEKRNYQELIKKFSDTIKPVNIRKIPNINVVAENSANLRLIQKAQKIAMNEINSFEKTVSGEEEIEEKKEYDPIVVASLNSSDSEIEIVSSENSSSSYKIDPINTLKDNLRINSVTSRDWLSKLDSKYKQKRKETQEKLKEARRESDIISKVNYEQKLAHLEQKLKYELSIPESLIVEPLPTAELPPLTAEQEQLVKRAIGPGPPGQLLVEKFNLRIHRRDLQTLAGLNWLNDEVINFYMNLLMQRSEENKDLPKVYATNTFFYPKLMQSGQAGLRRWTRKVDIFSHDLIVIPVHLGVHWCLSIIDFNNKHISYLDSMGSSNQPCLKALLQYLRDEHQDKKGQPFDDSGWVTENLKDIPQQMNGSDCGMFACTFAEFRSRSAPYTFTQAHMPYLRRKAALEILQARLLL